MRVHEVGAVGVGRVRNARGLAAEPHSMDRRLHNVVWRDVVVPWQWQPCGLHCDPAKVTMFYTLTLNKLLHSSYVSKTTRQFKGKQYKISSI